MQETNVFKIEQTPKINRWQPKILKLQGLKQDYWLINSAANIHICNNLRLMTNFAIRSTKIGGSTSDGILLRQRIVQIRLAMNNGIKRVILNFWNVYYFSNS